MDEDLHRRLATWASERPEVDALLLYGSRAREDHHEGSDWDFAVLPAPGQDVDRFALYMELGDLLETDHVDVANVERASGLLRYHVARDGLLLFEREPRIFEAFTLRALRHWFDIAPIVRAERDARFRRWGSASPEPSGNPGVSRTGVVGTP